MGARGPQPKKEKALSTRQRQARKTEKKNGHGGARPGAGRPPVLGPRAPLGECPEDFGKVAREAWARLNGTMYWLTKADREVAIQYCEMQDILEGERGHPESRLVCTYESLSVRLLGMLGGGLAHRAKQEKAAPVKVEKSPQDTALDSLMKEMEED